MSRWILSRFVGKVGADAAVAVGRSGARMRCLIHAWSFMAAVSPRKEI